MVKQLSTYINEKLVLNKGTFKNNYKYFPKDKYEFKNLINQLIEERKDNSIIDLNDINTSEINDLSFLFHKNKNIVNIDISRWNVSNVKDMYAMFKFCENLESVGDLSHWDVSKVEYMRCMFYNCEKLKDIGDISNWNVSNVKDMSYMFNRSNIKNIPSWYK